MRQLLAAKSGVHAPAMSSRSICFINVSQSPTTSQRAGIVLTFLLLQLASLSVSLRAHVCQAQAYALIIVAMIGLAQALHYGALRRDSMVTIGKSVYCSDLGKRTPILPSCPGGWRAMSSPPTNVSTFRESDCGCRLSFG
jgi:hypothetical protein